MTDAPGLVLGLVQLSGEGSLKDKRRNVSCLLEIFLCHQFLDMDFFGSKAAINLTPSSPEMAKVLKIWITSLLGIQCRFQ